MAVKSRLSVLHDLVMQTLQGGKSGLLGSEKHKLGLTYCLPQSSISRARAPKSILN